MGYHCVHMNSEPVTILSFYTLVDPKGTLGTLLPPSIFFSFSCSSRQKSCKIIGFNPNSRVGCARFPEFTQNFTEHQILWSLCLVDFHTFTLQLPIQTPHSVVPELQSFCEFT